MRTFLRDLDLVYESLTNVQRVISIKYNPNIFEKHLWEKKEFFNESFRFPVNVFQIHFIVISHNFVVINARVSL